MQLGKRKRIGCALVALLVSAGCTRADPVSVPKPPNPLDTFDGTPRSQIMTAAPLQIDPGPDAAALFARALECYPAPSWFRPEVTAELRAGSRTYSTAGEVVAPGGSLVMRVPLYSALELDREREREGQRRQKIADNVGQFLEGLVQYRLTSRELELLRGVEARAKARVAVGVAETAEQLHALREVAALENKRVQLLAKLTTVRIQLVALCVADRAPGMDNYLRRFQPLEPGQQATRTN